ncbi:hypothetical protein [Nocardia abscessus]|uniref:hypothetical protein n=1 Tax=Nocardia abscessus TaxID=120957 RepID=UPI002457FB29|nr:hypothetical protein [Nocardia abscessus]
MITAKELERHIGVLPYDSELFGVYQSLLGWKSARAQARFGAGLSLDRRSAIDRISGQFLPQTEVHFDERCGIEFRIRPGLLAAGVARGHSTHLMHAIAEQLPPLREYDERQWESILSPDRIEEALRGPVTERLQSAYRELCDTPIRAQRRGDDGELALKQSSLRAQLDLESAVAGALGHLVTQKQFTVLRTLFYTDTDHSRSLAGLLGVAGAKSAADYIDISTVDPTDNTHLSAVSLSPLSVVHLFRQYFFEFDSFLGTPVGHVWLSPGAEVELIEISTRRKYEERIIEQATETTVKTEQTVTVADELSDAVKESNRSDIAFGANADVHQGWVGGEANASTSFDLGTTQEKARETMHKRSRQQSDKLSTEIRQSFKSTFRTVTETTDTSSKRYLLKNGTEELVNYEMRRKMRQVGVQVQDVGSFMCWQTYVDDPGRTLGLGQLLHIAKEPDTGSLKNPEALPLLTPYTTSTQITIPFTQTSSDAGDKDEGYRYGVEIDSDFNEGERERIVWEHPQEAYCERANFVLSHVDLAANGESVEFDLGRLNIRADGPRWLFEIALAYANFRGKDAMTIGATLHWTPLESAKTAITDANNAKVKEYENATRDAYEKEFVESARDRVTSASKIRRRKYEDLREEERIVVYRALIQDLLTKDIPQPDDRTRHVVAELINTIFDVDKMLYFVSPEWWRPRLHRSTQELGRPTTPSVGNTMTPPVQHAAAQTGLSKDLIAQMPSLVSIIAALTKPKPDPLLADNIVGWGGVKQWRTDNYYLTEDSDPARLGASLGWLMQLDGDDLRNAFLNAPWVKAVLPIRPGMEEAALNWLTKVEGTNGIGPEDFYRTNNPNERDLDGKLLDGQPMLDVLRDLARRVRIKHEDSVKTGSYPEVDEDAGPANPVLVDAANTVTATPVDRVYEHGFYPLVGGFRNHVGTQAFPVVDQWVEILPTDQVVPVPVAYDPITGRMIAEP